MDKLINLARKAIIVMDASEVVQLHKFIWQDKSKELLVELDKVKDLVDAESVDTISSLPINTRFRGITPLCLAIMLGRKKCVHILLEKGASCLVATSAGFYPLSEAICLGDRKLLRDVMISRFNELRSMVKIRNPKLLKSLQDDLRDFYVELKWNFHSWLPFVASLLPHDTCRIWKKGSQLRIDSTLKGFEGYRWRRGDISFVINVGASNSSLFIVDHERKIYDEVNQLKDFEEDEIEKAVNSYLNVDIITAKLYKSASDGTPIEFQPKMKKPGWFGRGSKDEQIEEVISGYPCRVYDIRNVRWVTKTRHEHIRDCPKHAKDKEGKNIGEQLSSLENEEDWSKETEAEQQQAVQGFIEEYKGSMKRYAASLPPPPAPTVSFDDYFSDDNAVEYIHAGRPMDMKVKEKPMKACVWMADNYPLTIDELVPLLGLVAPTHKQFQKLVDFIESDLPEGFPVQIDIPIFSFLSAVCTFSGFTEWKEGLSSLPKSRPSDEPDSWFTIPSDYKKDIVIKNMYEKE